MAAQRQKNAPQEFRLSIKQANLYALIFILPLTLILPTVSILFLGMNKFAQGWHGFADILSLSAILLAIGGHELIHALFWASFVPGKWRAIRFGIKSLTPYCHCQEPMQVWQYAIGAAAPMFLLGLFPYFVGLALENAWLNIFGFLFTIAAGGDMLSLWMLSKYPANTFVLDHPSELGFKVVSESI